MKKNQIHHRIWREVYTTTENGWKRLNWLFFMIGGAGIFAKIVFGIISTPIAIAVTFLFFYGIGKMHSTIGNRR